MFKGRSGRLKPLPAARILKEVEADLLGRAGTVWERRRFYPEPHKKPLDTWCCLTPACRLPPGEPHLPPGPLACPCSQSSVAASQESGPHLASSAELSLGPVSYSAPQEVYLHPKSQNRHLSWGGPHTLFQARKTTCRAVCMETPGNTGSEGKGRGGPSRKQAAALLARPERPAPPPEGTRATARLATRSPRKRASVRAETPALPQTPEHRATAPWSRAEESEGPEGRAVPGVAAPARAFTRNSFRPARPPRAPVPAPVPVPWRGC